MKRRRQHRDEQLGQDIATGSLASGGPVFLAIGKLRRAHGLQGEMTMEILTDFPDRIRSGKRVYVGDNYEPIEIASVRPSNQALLIRLEGIHSPEDAARLRNMVVFVKAVELPKLPDGEYYHHQLIGLSVITEDGQAVGELSEILETGANDVYIVKTPVGREILLPAIHDVILDVNFDLKQMRVRLLDWY